MSKFRKAGEIAHEYCVSPSDGPISSKITYLNYTEETEGNHDKFQ